MGIKDFTKKYYLNDMVKGDVIFCAAGVTDGELLKGIKINKKYFSSEILALHSRANIKKIIKDQFEI